MIGTDHDEPASIPDRLAAEVARVSDRLRTLSLTRLSAPFPPYASRAEAGHLLAQRLAVAAQGVDERREAGPPVWRRLPRLADHATGDQVAVTGRDLLEAVLSAEPDARVWTPDGPRSLAEVMEEVLDALRELRLSL
jgi:hypothetical protein